MKSLFLLMALLSSFAHAGELTIKYGMGAGHQIVPTVQEKIVKLGWQSELGKTHLCYSAEGGVYVDSDRGVISGLGFLSIGPRVYPFSWMYFQNKVGVGFITTPDDLLGGPFQFEISMGLGVQEPMTGPNIGLEFFHISSAGIYQPNAGRNFWLLNIGIPL